MDFMVGKGIIYTGDGELALYNDWLTSDAAKVVGTVKSGNPVGVIVAENTDTNGIQFSDGHGGYVFTNFEPDYMKVVDYDPGQVINGDTSWFSSTNDTNTLTLTNTLPPASVTTAQAKKATEAGNPPVARIVDGLKRNKPPYLYIAIGAAALIVITYLIAHHPKAKTPPLMPA